MRMEAYALTPLAMALKPRPSRWMCVEAPYAGTPYLSIIRPNITEWRHSSPISVRAYCVRSERGSWS